MFQSTRPRGARHDACLSVLYLKSFNPRARVGRDQVVVTDDPEVEGFNPRARVGRDST